MTIRVVATGSAAAPADCAVINVGVWAEAEDVSAALSQVADSSRSVAGAARSHGVADADIASVGMGVQQRYDPMGQLVPGFRAHHQLRIKCRDLPNTGALLNALVAAGSGSGLSIDGLNLEIADPAPLVVVARERAMADARERASQLARLAGLELGAIMDVVEGGGGGGVRPMAMEAARASDSSMTFEAGEESVVVSLDVTFATT